MFRGALIFVFGGIIGIIFGAIGGGIVGYFGGTIWTELMKEEGKKEAMRRGPGNPGSIHYRGMVPGPGVVQTHGDDEPELADEPTPET